jgi:hypothetical protein
MPRYIVYISRVSLLSSATRISGAGDHAADIMRSRKATEWLRRSGKPAHGRITSMEVEAPYTEALTRLAVAIEKHVSPPREDVVTTKTLVRDADGRVTGLVEQHVPLAKVAADKAEALWATMRSASDGLTGGAGAVAFSVDRQLIPHNVDGLHFLGLVARAAAADSSLHGKSVTLRLCPIGCRHTASHAPQAAPVANARGAEPEAAWPVRETREVKAEDLTIARSCASASPTFRGLLAQGIPQARQILRLLVGRLECEAFQHGATVGYGFKACGSYVTLPPAGLSTPEVVTPAGHGPGVHFEIAGTAVA